MIDMRNTVPSGEGERRPWGRWCVLGAGPGFKVKLLEVAAGHRLSLQYHRHRSETWVVVAGCADAVVGDARVALPCGAVQEIPTGAVHRLGNPGPAPLLVVEVQRGEQLEEDDIVRLADDYRRGTPRASA